MESLTSRTSIASSTEPPEETEKEEVKPRVQLRKWSKPDSDDEEDLNRFFDVKAAWESLLSLPSCLTLMIKLEEQKKLKLVVGTNVSQEFPWKQIRLQHLYNADLFENIDNGEEIITEFRNHKPDHHILIGYAPIITQDLDDIPTADPFITFSNPEDAKEALIIVRSIEGYEDWCMTQRLHRKPRHWTSYGSGREVQHMQNRSTLAPLDVEIQSVYPLRIPGDKKFSMRLADDVRDGYIELLPQETIKFENISRKRITVAIQSSPTLVTVEQQTNPTFPTNAWSQYVYEINDDDDELDATTDEEDEAKKRKSGSGDGLPVEKNPLELSEQIMFLLQTLEFNQVDMYRNDYPLISDRVCMHYVTPILEETLCFANISKSFKRFVCAVDWFPSISGLMVVSYTFSTPATFQVARQMQNIVQRDVLEPNPILMWSISDNLNIKLEFYAPREVTALSFCPYNPSLLVGGMSNGQVVIWDLQDRIAKLDVEEILTAAQQKYRFQMNDFLAWTIQLNDDQLVTPAIITNLEESHTGPITAIQWMSNRHYLNEYGKVCVKLKNEQSHFFMTVAANGSIFFWNLDALKDSKIGAAARRELPKALLQSESAYKNKQLSPTYKLKFAEPVSNILADTTIFSSVPLQLAKGRSNQLNYPIKIITDDPKEMRQFLISSSLFGHVDGVEWFGLYGGDDLLEHVSPVIKFARVHDGPILSIKRNPFLRNIFVSIGRNIMAVWKEDFPFTPILWRKCQKDLTAVAWSENRPSVVFLTRADGSLEAWDLIIRDDTASLVDTIGGGLVTAISEHKQTEPEKLLGIGDYNSSFRMVRLPDSIYVPISNEKRAFSDYIDKEESRKKFITAWEQRYNEMNKDVIEAKRQSAQEARNEMERAEKEAMEARKAKEQLENVNRNEEAFRPLSYSERVAEQWEDMNFKRMMDILMSRKRVDAEQLAKDSMLEKGHLAYEADKKLAVENVKKNVANEVAAIRARILPTEKLDLRRIDMVQASVRELLESVESYDDIEEEYDNQVGKYEIFDDIDYLEFLQRGDHRRKLLNKSLGGNTERFYWYDESKERGDLNECDWGYEYFMRSANKQTAKKHETKPDSENVLEFDDIEEIEDE